MAGYNTLREIYDVAEATRLSFERRTVDRDNLSKIYLSYNPHVVTPDYDIDDFLDKAADSFPNGNCGLTSVQLCEDLGIGEPHTGTYAGELHTFVLLPQIIITRRQLIVDISADQFAYGPSIYVGSLTYPWEF